MLLNVQVCFPELLVQARRRGFVKLRGFADQFLVAGDAPREGQLMKLPALANTLYRLAAHGTEDFYSGEIARDLASNPGTVALLATAFAFPYALGQPILLESSMVTTVRVRQPMRVTKSLALPVSISTSFTVMMDCRD